MRVGVPTGSGGDAWSTADGPPRALTRVLGLSVSGGIVSESPYEKMWKMDLVTHRHCFDCAFQGCESEIEKGLAAAFVVLHGFRVDDVYGENKGTLLARGRFVDLRGQERAVDLHAQVEIGRYRVDLMLMPNDSKTPKIVIECDGHDFHERTKEQATRDRSRDRELTRDGYVVIRFTGAEIWKNVSDCAEQAMDLLRSRAVAP